MEWAALVALGTAALVALAVAGVVARRRRRALGEVHQGIVALEAGRPARPVQARVGGTTGLLAQTFNEVAPKLEARVQGLEGNRQLLLAVLGGMTEGVIAVDARCRLLFANDAANRLFSLGPGAVGRLIVELIRSPQVQAVVDATLAGADRYQTEITIPPSAALPRAQSLILAVRGTKLPGSSDAAAVLVFHDITETRRLERVRQDFVANASHELKTPLASIKACAETLLGGALNDSAVNVKFLHSIDEQADRLNDLILGLLSLARLDDEQQTFHHGPLALEPVIRQAVDAQRDRAVAKHLDYRLDVETDTAPTVVTADEEAVRQILDNLIDNAIKYTPEQGNVRVRLRGAGESALIEVADSGPGIPRDELSRIFERFYRVDRGRSRAQGGTGLGLAIVKHLVQSIGGQVSVDSRVGVGSTFTVRLPRTGAANAG
jgi:two-component system phosphate regulon sensor histidine kinase PhoR